jgi:hypothetical protein
MSAQGAATEQSECCVALGRSINERVGRIVRDPTDRPLAETEMVRSLLSAYLVSAHPGLRDVVATPWADMASPLSGLLYEKLKDIRHDAHPE